LLIVSEKSIEPSPIRFAGKFIAFLYLCRKLFCSFIMSAYSVCRLTAPDRVQGEIALPASKSISNRALVLYALAGKQSLRTDFADCEDSLLMLNALQSPEAVKDAGAAGTVMRFLTAYYAQTPGEWTLTGTERMKQRPIGLLVDALRQLGADITYTENPGYPPLLIKGKRLSGGRLSIDGSISSQYITALMLIGPYVDGGLEIELLNKIASAPYIRMTLGLMQAFGAQLSFEGNLIRIAAGAYTAPEEFRVEADWSAASYWFEVLSLARSGQVLLHGLQADSLQGDAKVMEWFRDFGVQAEFIELPAGKKTSAPAEVVPELIAGKALPESIPEKALPESVGSKVAGSPQAGKPGKRALLLSKTKQQCSFFEADFSQQPDLAQTFVVTAALRGIPFRIGGLESLKIKETDRLQALIREMLKLGFILEESSPNTLEWQGKKQPAQSRVSIATYQDHRMAMSFAPVALRIKDQNEIKHFEIEDPTVVAKSYPGFWEDLKSCGFTIEYK
jgi:3-phosphoshikimate 1-carboxyvinyltransferase